MSDTTHEAPERIWATGDAENFGEDRFHTTRPTPSLTEYVRADLVEASEQQGYANAMEDMLATAEKIIATAKEMYETAMLTGGGSPEAWVNHVRARKDFASALAELKGELKGEPK